MVLLLIWQTKNINNWFVDYDLGLIPVLILFSISVRTWAISATLSMTKSAPASMKSFSPFDILIFNSSGEIVFNSFSLSPTRLPVFVTPIVQAPAFFPS